MAADEYPQEHAESERALRKDASHGVPHNLIIKRIEDSAIRFAHFNHLPQLRLAVAFQHLDFAHDA